MSTTADSDPEGRHTYYCNHSQTNRIFWQLNGVKILSFNVPPGVSISSDITPDGGRVPTLTIGGRPELNETAIQCVAELELDGTSNVVTPEVVFLIQGQSTTFNFFFVFFFVLGLRLMQLLLPTSKDNYKV